MVKKVIISLLGLVIGIIAAYFFILYPSFSLSSERTILFDNSHGTQDEVIGFLPYWLINKAKPDYSDYITNLTYFALSIDRDGRIQKLTSPVEAEPGWYALSSGKADNLLKTAKDKGLLLSLAVFSGDHEAIAQLVSNPVVHAQNLVQDILPIMREYGFGELNLDIESTAAASSGAAANFTKFTRELKSQLTPHNISLTVDITGQDLIKKTLINPNEVGQIADHVLVMTYDFHHPGSKVTGAVAPLFGAGVTAEYDVVSAIKKASDAIPSKKIILGLPLYGYEWETIDDTLGGAVIPGTGMTASTRRIDELLAVCSSCSAKFDQVSKESYVIYQDAMTGAYHQLFFPDRRSTQAKLEFMEDKKLGGIGLWALGYEDESAIEPLKVYLNSSTSNFSD